GTNAGSPISLRPDSPAQGSRITVDLAATLLQLLGGQVQNVVGPSTIETQDSTPPLGHEDVLAGAGLRDVFFRLDSGFGSASAAIDAFDVAAIGAPSSSSAGGAMGDGASQAAAKPIGDESAVSSIGAGIARPGSDLSDLSFVSLTANGTPAQAAVAN